MLPVVFGVVVVLLAAYVFFYIVPELSEPSTEITEDMDTDDLL